MKRRTLTSALIVIATLGQYSYGGLIVTLGDLDGGHYDGLGSVDHVYVDAQYMEDHKSVLYQDNNTVWYRNRIVGFDSWKSNQQVLFSFQFDYSEEITEAWLTLVFAPISSDFVTDNLIVAEDDTGASYRLSDFNWDQGTGKFVVGTLDLSAHLADLEDGLLNLRMIDDTCVDYALLTFNDDPLEITPVTANRSGVPFPPYDPVPRPDSQTIPLPSSVVLGLLGFVCVRKGRQRRPL